MELTMMGSLEKAGAVKRDGESWRITERGLAAAAALATLRRKSGDDGINFDHAAWREADKAFDHAAFDAKLKAVEDEVFGDGETAATLDDWMAANERIMKDAPRPPFKPNATYNKHGDGLHVYLCDEPSHTQWLCPGVEVMRAESDDRIVGFNVWGLSRTVARDGGELRRLQDEDERFMTVKAFLPPGIDRPGGGSTVKT